MNGEKTMIEMEKVGFFFSFLHELNFCIHGDFLIVQNRQSFEENKIERMFSVIFFFKKKM